MRYDIVMAFGYSIIAANYFKQKEMNEKNIKIEDLIKRDDFISVTNEANELFGDPRDFPVHSFYKVKMRSRKVFKKFESTSPFEMPRPVYMYMDIFDREVQLPEYYIMVSKPWQPTYHYIVDKNFNITVRNGFDPSPLVNGEQLFTTKKAADMYVYENKKVFTAAEVDKKTKAAYENGKNVGSIDERNKIEDERMRQAYLNAFGSKPKW